MDGTETIGLKPETKKVVNNHGWCSHQKFWIVDGEAVGWSTGNWGNSDFPADSNTTTTVTYPPYGAASPGR